MKPYKAQIFIGVDGITYQRLKETHSLFYKENELTRLNKWLQMSACRKGRSTGAEKSSYVPPAATECFKSTKLLRVGDAPGVNAYSFCFLSDGVSRDKIKMDTHIVYVWRNTYRKNVCANCFTRTSNVKSSDLSFLLMITWSYLLCSKRRSPVTARTF